MGDLVVKRWTRYGQDRLYVNDAADGSRVGWLDLQTDGVVLEREDIRAAFDRAIAPYRREAVSQAAVLPTPPSGLEAAPAPAPPPATTVLPPPPPADEPAAVPSTTRSVEPTALAPPTPQHENFAVTIDWRGLSAQGAGAAAQQQARAERDAAPVRTFAAR